jgi:hypothetical protein
MDARVLHYSSSWVNSCAMAVRLQRISALIAAFGAAFAYSAAFDARQASANSVVVDNWTTRPNVTERVLLLKANHPANAVMLLPGGHGNLNLDAQGNLGWGEDDFAVRTRFFYYDHGIAAIVPDVASDHKPPAALAGFRTSEQQADDLQALSDQLHGMAPKVWMIAYDTGAASALNAFARGKANLIAGLVLISPILEEPSLNSAALIDAAKLAMMQVPVLVIGHQSDRCSAADIARLNDAAAAVKAAHFQLLTMTGGRSRFLLLDPFGYPEGSCNARPAHALAGLEDAVSGNIIEWIAHQGASPVTPLPSPTPDIADANSPPATQVTPVSALPEPSTPDFRWQLVRGLNVQVLGETPMVAGQPVLRMIATSNDKGHTLSLRLSGLNKGQTYRIAAWVKPVAGGNVELAALDQPDADTQTDSGAATFDLYNHQVLEASGVQARDVEQHVNYWQKVWIDLPTADGQFQIAVRPIKGQTNQYVGDGKLGVILGGIETEPVN